MSKKKICFVYQWSHGESGTIMVFNSKEEAEEYAKLWGKVYPEEAGYCGPLIDEAPLFSKGDLLKLKTQYAEKAKEEEKKRRKTHCPTCDRKRKLSWTFCPGCGTKLFQYNR